ncbi:hypothetical protein MVEN_00249100 [Mycena venus]|uniref:Heme haloperoxidase family profile domain-containing protein n=1 Tax=Mycena venus TaxID=2733690 RepID=A0A8H6Z4N3_9AGAR|nr:hypothetical protein MVEN_00249100 [Mycena venus]
MPHLKFFLILVAVCITDASSSDTSNHQWISPEATDSGETWLSYQKRGKYFHSNDSYAASEGFNFGPDPVLLTAKFRLLSGAELSTTLGPDALKLHLLDAGNLLEHDVSLSWDDFALGDNLNFNETIFTTSQTPTLG